MGITFSIRKFAYPISILKLRRFLEKSQWFSEEELKEYQNKRLKEIIEHCYENVPYYRNLFRALKLKTDDFKETEDLKKLPLLTRDIIRKNFHLLTAKNCKKFRPFLYKTSGTSGNPLEFYLDKPMHILEFCYYWRHWSWGGYRLGDPFVEFSFNYFIDGDMKNTYKYMPLTKNLIFNSTQVSFANLDRFVTQIRKHKPLFLKGLPSIITSFALLLEKAGYTDIHFKAVFTSAETLLPYHQQIIEKAFHCRILDSYSHMESTVAVSQCPHGSYHVNPEYGVFSVEEKEQINDYGGDKVGEIIGTSLHNFTMPFLRYKTGDLAVDNSSGEKCPCGRGLPLVKNIVGKTLGVFITPDDRFVSGIAIPMKHIEGIRCFQIIQESKKEFIIKITRRDDIPQEFIKERLTYYYKEILGEDIDLTIKFVPLDSWDKTSKHSSVVSKLNVGDFI